MKQVRVPQFQKRVYDTVSHIPRGCVSTYGIVARHIGCGSAQAVGQALRRNPFAPDIPCHRVISASLTIGGFAGKRAGGEIARKYELLEQEGVEFRDGTLKDPERLVCF